MALRSIGRHFKGLPNKNLSYLRPALCLPPAPPTTWPRSGDKRLVSMHQVQQQQIDFCEHFYKNTNRTCFQRCTLNEEWQRPAVCYPGQNEENALLIQQKMASSEHKFPNLDVKLPIRKVAPVSKEIKNVVYISPEFKELLRKHDVQRQQKYILSFLPEKYTSTTRKPKTVMKPYCICEELKQTTATAASTMKVPKRRNFFQRLSCCTKPAVSVEAFKECQCSRGQQGKCEMCSPSLANKPILKKNIKKSKEKKSKLSKAKSVEISKDAKEAKNRFWVGTGSDVQENVVKREKFRQAFEKQNKLQLPKKDKKKDKSKKVDKKISSP